MRPPMPLVRTERAEANDAELVARVRSGDVSALGVLYDRYSQDVRRVIVRLGVGAADVDDVLQETFLDVVRGAKNYDGRPVAKPWLIGLALNWVRRRRRSARILLRYVTAWADEPPAARRSPEDEAVDALGAARAREALEGLSAKKRDVFVLVVLEGLPGEEVARLFNVLSGYSMESSYQRLLVAPHSVRSGLIERIERESDNFRRGLPARVRIKCNSIVDEATLDALYRASQVGVPIDIWVRGICAVRPGVPGLSETIRVRSVLGRFLEHSRIYEFDNAGDPEVWIGSADLMHRNLDRRIEVLLHIGSDRHSRDLSALIDLAFDPANASWHLGPDGEWTRVHLAEDGTPLADVQELLIARRSRGTQSIP